MRSVPLLGTSPTIVVGAGNGASSISGSVLTPSCDSGTHALTGPYRYLGANVAWWGTTNCVWAVGSLSDTHDVQTFSVEFMCNADAFEVYTTGGNGTIRLWVDGIRAVSTAMPGDGQPRYVLVTFTSATSRRIRLDFHHPPFGGIRVGPSYAISAASPGNGIRAIFLGDSYTAGAAIPAAYLGFPRTCGEIVGWEDVWISGSGGTGYLNPGGAGQTTLRGRVQNDVIQWNPNIVVVCGGVNDGAYSAAQVGAEAALLFAAIRAGVPAARLIVTSSLDNGTSQAILDRSVALRVAAAGVRAEYIDVAGEHWFRGTGNVSAPNGTGNNDTFFGPASHPVQDGYDYLGARLADGIRPPATGLARNF